MFEQGLSRVVLAEEEQRHALRMLGVEREVVGALFRDPLGTQGQDCTGQSGPSGPSGEGSMGCPASG